MIRVADASKTIDFYSSIGLAHVASLPVPEFDFTLHFLAAVGEHERPPEAADRKEVARWLWTRPYPTLELTHNTLKDGEKPEVYVSGDKSPRGFAGIAVGAGSDKRDGAAVAPADVKGVARDPDGYAVGSSGKGLSRVALRVNDAAKSVAFFERLGLARLASIPAAEGETHHFLGYAGAETPPPSDPVAASAWVSAFRGPLIQLIAGSSPDGGAEKLTNGNETPHRGFGHIGLLVDDVAGVTERMRALGYEVVRDAKPFLDFAEISFVKDDDVGYWVELIQRAGGAPEGVYRVE